MSKRNIPDGMRKQFSKSCMEIIRLGGDCCSRVACIDCPFASFYHATTLDCVESKACWAAKSAGTIHDLTAVLSSARWIAKHGTKKAKRWLVERLCNGKAGY